MDNKDKILYSFLIGVIGATVFFYVSPVRIVSVVGRSMEPTISEDDAVLIAPAGNEDIKSGDIIAFRHEEQRIIHRVGGFENGKIQTEGDNSGPDSFLVEYSEVFGKHLLTIPRVGPYLVRVYSPLGFIFLILVPSALLVHDGIERIRKDERD